MATFKVGDKVIVATSNIDTGGKCKYENEIGTIRYIDESYEYPYAVDGTSYGSTLWVTVKGLAEDKKKDRKPGEFLPGDRVKANCAVGRAGKEGQIGRVIGKYTYDYLIEFDNHITGHDGLGNKDADGNLLIGKNKHCWYVPARNLILIEEGKDGKDGKRDFDWDWDIETDVYTPNAIEVPIVLLSFSYTELFQLRFAYRHGFKYAAKMNNELWFFKEDPHYPSAFKITEVI